MARTETPAYLRALANCLDAEANTRRDLTPEQRRQRRDRADDARIRADRRDRGVRS